MFLEKLGDKLVDSPLAITLMSSGILEIFSYTTFNVFHSFSLICLALCFLNLGSLFLKTTFSEKLGVCCLKKVQKDNNALFKIYHEKFLTKKEQDINQAVHLFTNSLFRLNRQTPRYSELNSKERLFFSHYYHEFNQYKDTLLPLYEQYFKPHLVLAKTILQGVMGSEHANIAFITLWELHHKKLTQEEFDYLNQHIKKIKDVTLLTDETIFKGLKPTLQEKVLELIQDKSHAQKTYDNLIYLHRATNKIVVQKKELHHIEPLDEKQIKSQEKIEVFKKSFNLVFTNQSNVLHLIDELLLAKDQMALFLEQYDTGKRHIEAKIFLNNDIEQLLESFQEEVAILNKMQMTHHQEVDNRKALILDSMIERLQLVQNKMKAFSQEIHLSMDNELELELGIHQTVLKSKM